jgi:tetratricopeptide (TPR) repeat protein
MQYRTILPIIVISAGLFLCLCGNDHSAYRGRTLHARAIQARIDSLYTGHALQDTLMAVCVRFRAQLGDTALASCALLDSIISRAAARIEIPQDSVDTTHAYPARAMVQALRSQVYTRWNIGFDTCRDNPQTVLPHEVVLHEQGSCLGVSLLFLLLARRVDAPLYGVLLPGHFFVRYDDGSARINIEPNRGGYRYQDSAYRVKYRLDSYPWYDMANLSDREVIAVTRFNLANILRKRGRLSEAAAQYARVVAVMPQYAPAYGNYALTCAAQGRHDTAQRLLRRVVALRPGLAKGYVNLGAHLLERTRYREALAVYRDGMRHSGDSLPLLYGSAVAWYYLGRPDSLHYYYRQVRRRDTAGIYTHRLAPLVDR